MGFKFSECSGSNCTLLSVSSPLGAVSFSEGGVEVLYSRPEILGCDDWGAERGVVKCAPELKELLRDESVELDELSLE